MKHFCTSQGCVPRMEFGFLRHCLEQNLTLSWNLKASSLGSLATISHLQRLPLSMVASSRNHYKNSLLLKRYLVRVGSTEEEHSLSEDSLDDSISRPLTSDELKSLLIDNQRSKIVKKLSEANQHNRFLKRQLKTQEDEITSIKSELAIMELEVQALVNLAEEIANLGIPQGSRKISGKYIQSHLLTRLDAVHNKLKEQIKDVEAAQSKEVNVFWIGMAESVQVMGSFDGWSQPEDLSPEYTASFTKFSTTLVLRPGRYEMKFLVDGEWQISREFPTSGEGMLENNVLVVE
ncbi:PREDICTED: protein PTST, chloroplastic [Brassica oleracea var. oleracea]|uniref:protein PTST, chloroplastic n=1 Tax=Brassica oleracea var. oleracea TaxID=109376 RepID=UPI0006A75366|nr:PREDICTED: protein PTST, chloroplastic [Brassica oleracea var. oleracea]